MPQNQFLSMKRILFVTVMLFSIFSFKNAEARKTLFSIYIGGFSNDGSSIGIKGIELSWGGGCHDGSGVCLDRIIKTNNDNDNNNEFIEISEDLSMTIEVTKPNNLKQLEVMRDGEYIEFKENSLINSLVNQEYDFLEKKSKYIIPAGRYQIIEENGKLLIQTKIQKI